MDHHRKPHFTDDGVKKDTNTKTEITHQSKYPSGNALSLNLYNKYIPVGDSVTSIDLPNGIDSAHLKKTLLITGGAKPLLFTAQANDVVVDVHYFSNQNIIKHYNNVDHRIISINSDN